MSNIHCGECGAMLGQLHKADCPKMTQVLRNDANETSPHSFKGGLVEGINPQARDRRGKSDANYTAEVERELLKKTVQCCELTLALERSEALQAQQYAAQGLSDAQWGNLLDSIDDIATQEGNGPLSEKALDRIKRSIIFYVSFPAAPAVVGEPLALENEAAIWDAFLAALERLRPVGKRHAGMLKAVKKYRLLGRE